MNKKQIIRAIEHKVKSFNSSYFIIKAVKLLNSLEYGKDYEILDNNGRLLKAYKTILDYEINDLSDVRNEDVVYRYGPNNFAMFMLKPYEKISWRDGKYIVNMGDIIIEKSLGELRKRIDIPLEIKSEKGKDEFDDLIKEYEEYEDDYYSMADFVDIELPKILKFFKNGDEFMDFIKDKKEYENLYKYLSK